MIHTGASEKGVGQEGFEMLDVKIQHEIARQLEQMPEELQRRVLDFVQILAQPRPKGEPGKELLRFAGLLDADSAREIAEAIEAGCERPDPNGW